ncbi:MAG: CARDB domain-containing protein [Pyrinomonadaceae bacterium]
MTKLKAISVSGFLLLTVVLAASTARAQRPNPKLDSPQRPVKVALPDLRITSVIIDAGKMDVEVTNMCKGTAGGNRLILSLYEGPDKKSKVGEQVGLDVPPLKAGEKTTLTFDMQQYGSKYTSFAGRYFHLLVDETNKVKESQEGNNYYDKGAMPFPNGPHSCDPQ